MPTDPHRERRSGLLRLRLATASLGIAAVLGVGGLTWTISAQEATSAVSESTVSGTTTNPTTADSTTTESATTTATVEADDSDDDADASSGGS